MKKMTGKEWKDFYGDPNYWKEGIWFDGEYITIDGEPIEDDEALDQVKDDSIVRILSGVVFLNDEDTVGVSLETYYARWKKEQTTVTLVVRVNKTRLPHLEQLIKDNGGKIL